MFTHFMSYMMVNYSSYFIPCLLRIILSQYDFVFTVADLVLWSTEATYYAVVFQTKIDIYKVEV